MADTNYLQRMRYYKCEFLEAYWGGHHALRRTSRPRPKPALRAVHVLDASHVHPVSAVPGHIAVDLSAAVPSVRTWRFAALPEHLSPDQIQQALDSCDRRRSIGRRDYAVPVLLARLGPRANEIATLTLDDVDWHSSCLTIRGKGR